MPQFPVDENEIVITINKKGEVVFVINNTKTMTDIYDAAHYQCAPSGNSNVFMPDPEDFDTERHHFCLLARIVSTQDPTGTEVQEVGQNVRNFNNLRENLFAQIYDVFGKRWSLQTMPVPDKGRSSARFNVEALPAGLYYLRIALPGLNIQTVRFIKI